MQQGGRILGICAGTYCLAEKSSFHSHIKQRGFDFFSGDAIGPLYSLKMKAAAVVLENTAAETATKGKVAVMQGGYFVPNERPQNPYKVLAR